MATVVQNSRLIFVDSETNTVGNKGHCKINIPQHPFSVCCQDQMRLTLLSFDMRRNWYSVNATNNTFYIRNAGNVLDTYDEVTIAPGSYETFAELAAAVQTALQAVTGLAAATCTYTRSSRKFTFNLTGAGANAFIVAYQAKGGGALPVGVSENGFFQDVHELLGLIPSRTQAPVNACGGTTGPGAHVAPFPGALNTLECIYLRTNLIAGNYATYGTERFLPDENGLTETALFARIPLNKTCFDDFFSFIQFEDSNDLYQIHMQQKAIDQLELFVTDDKGRLLSEVDPLQADLGMLNFKVVLRWDHMRVTHPPITYVPTPAKIHSQTRWAMAPDGA